MTADVNARAPLASRLWDLTRRHVGELSRFLSVGAVAYVIDAGLFNLLRYGPGELLADKPLTAKIIAATLATLFSWVGNRYWTFATKRTSSPVRELVVFIVVNVAAMGAAVVSLWFSHYVLRLTSPLADNISANVVGVALGTAIRYVAYKFFVFTGAAEPAAVEAAIEAEDRASRAEHSD
ncbi:GtrA family protein [Actinotalea sp. M2MS4P-6]|uniref:GtrA family protein n=1 Tax=Actinotalea sp. M2MS4P-6 TaxID=2983762 RepID=UPI0021E50EAE|nr:GtrA family protein [Actinotalea sp. M2MS4P-6]MCV2396355.1 GtrA family protein [Actinotalea sp. M2MS4P-6]